jgi:hypothetical protein
MSVFPLVSTLSLQCIVQTAPMISVAGVMFAQPQTDCEPDQGPCFGRRFRVSIGTRVPRWCETTIGDPSACSGDS